MTETTVSSNVFNGYTPLFSATFLGTIKFAQLFPPLKSWCCNKCDFSHFLQFLIYKTAGFIILCCKLCAKGAEVDCGKIGPFSPRYPSSLLLLSYFFAKLDGLKNDIINGSEWDTLCFGKLTSFGIIAKCKTVLRDKVVTTIWELNQDFNVRLITLIPRGDKTWNSN